MKKREDIEIENILGNFNNTSIAYKKNQTLIELFESQVKKNPSGIAIISEKENITYDALNRKANQLATILREKGIKKDDLVVLVAERSIEMIIGIYGILKSGGAYVPVDYTLPKSRISYIINDCNPKAILTYKFEFSTNTIPIINLEEIKKLNGIQQNLKSVNKSDDLAYCIYTSGTTGVPKGVLVEHKSVNNFLNNIYLNFDKDFGPNDRCLCLTNISFDVSVCEIFLPLVYGATLVLYTNQRIDIVELATFIVANKITFAYIPPGILNEVYNIIEKYKTVFLNKLLVGVEPIRYTTLQKYMDINPAMKIINAYGPTEATICATMYKLNNNSSNKDNNNIVPIGKPMFNYNIYIVDKDYNLLPYGVSGELCISGDGVARGYLNNDKLNKKKFINNPFGEGKIYCTGDNAKWLPDGNIEFIGRSDNQVKIRGYRIELGEIENVIKSIAYVDDVIVLAKKDKYMQKNIYAYIVSEKDFTLSEIRNELEKLLPDYMVPSFMMKIDKIPVTENGKKDKNALPDIKMNTEDESIEPETSIEKELVEIWKEILDLDVIGVNHNFLDIGGNSLYINRMLAKINGLYDINISLIEIFKSGLNIRDLSFIIEEKLLESLSEDELKEIIEEIEEEA